MTNLIATYTPGGTRSDSAGINDVGFGFTFTGTTGFVPTSLGAWMVAGDVGSWIVRLVNGANTVLLATATIVMGGGTTPAAFNYAACVALASLTNGQTYILMVNVPTLQVFNDTAPITCNNASGISGKFSVPVTLGAGNGSFFGSNNMYGGVDMVFSAPVVGNKSNFFFAS